LIGHWLLKVEQDILSLKAIFLLLEQTWLHPLLIRKQRAYAIRYHTQLYVCYPQNILNIKCLVYRNNIKEPSVNQAIFVFVFKVSNSYKSAAYIYRNSNFADDELV